MGIPLSGRTRQFNYASRTLPDSQSLIVPAFNADGFQPAIPLMTENPPGIALSGKARIASPFPGIGERLRAIFAAPMQALFIPHPPRAQVYYYGAPPARPYQAPPEYSSGTAELTATVFSSLTSQIAGV